MSFLVCRLAKLLLDNMEGILTDIVHSNTYGSNLWLIILPRMHVYSYGREQAYNTKSEEARAKK
jgi:hypothetical protein